MGASLEVYQPSVPENIDIVLKTTPTHGTLGSTKTFPTISDVLAGQTILITGAAGFVGIALIHRLVNPDLRVRRVFALVRGEDPVSRFPEDLRPHITGINKNGQLDRQALVVALSGDSSIPGFGLSDLLSQKLQEVDIVIHSAGNNRFTLSLPEAVKASTDLAYTVGQFTINNPKARTHIHLSTCFTGWFLPSGSIVHEELVPAINTKVQQEEHPNSYLQAKSIAEGIVNAMGRQSLGNTAWRILRLSTLGPAISFPTPGWGAGHTSSPISAAIAAEVVRDSSFAIPDVELDVVPIDIAVAQILGLTAAAHNTNIVLPNGSNIPVYNIAVGDGSGSSMRMDILNKPELKLKNPYIPAKNVVAAYRPMMKKIIRFDTSRTRQVIGLPLYPGASAWTNSGKATGFIEGGTVLVTDSPIDVTGFKVDLDVALENIGGWVQYLKLVRDKMENVR